MGVAAKTKNLAPDWAKEIVRPTFRVAGQATSRLRPFPDYLIIGTKRGGTTSMYKYLLRHPNVVPMWPGVENAKKTHFFDQNFDHGELWYRAHFPTSMQRSRVARRTGARRCRARPRRTTPSTRWWPTAYAGPSPTSS